MNDKFFRANFSESEKKNDSEIIEKKLKPLKNNLNSNKNRNHPKTVKQS